MLQAILEHEGESKFLVLQVGSTQRVRFTMVSYAGLDYAEILTEYRGYEVDPDEKVTVLGGGKVGIYHKLNRITVYGRKCAAFGSADPLLIKLILKKNFAKYSLKLDIKSSNKRNNKSTVTAAKQFNSINNLRHNTISHY